MSIQNNISDDYLSQYNISLGVSAVQKINSFPYLQTLAYNAILASIAQDFLGLEDWATQIETYSLTNTAILKPAYNVIKPLIPLNAEISADLTYIDGLGNVGDAFETIQGYAKVFSVSGSELTDPSSISQKASNFS